MKKLVFELPMPLSINDYYKPTYNRATGRCFLRKSDKAKAYALKVLPIVFKQTDGKTFFTKNVTCEIEFHFDKKLITQFQKWRDVDNGIKCLLDSLTINKLWTDDRIVSKFAGVERFFDSESNYAVIKVWGE